MRTLCAGEDRVRGGWRSGGGRRQAHLDALLSQEPHTSASVDPAAGVAPEQRCRTDTKRMQEDAHLARLCGRAAIPLTRLSQWTRATVTNAGHIHQTQIAVSLPTPLLEVKRLSCGTAQRPIRLERKVGSGEAPRFPRRVAGVGGPYPAAGGEEGGRLAVCSFCEEMAAANSVVRTGSG